MNPRASIERLGRSLVVHRTEGSAGRPGGHLHPPTESRGGHRPGSVCRGFGAASGSRAGSIWGHSGAGLCPHPAARGARGGAVGAARCPVPHGGTRGPSGGSHRGGPSPGFLPRGGSERPCPAPSFPRGQPRGLFVRRWRGQSGAAAARGRLRSPRCCSGRGSRRSAPALPAGFMREEPGGGGRSRAGCARRALLPRSLPARRRGVGGGGSMAWPAGPFSSAHLPRECGAAPRREKRSEWRQTAASPASPPRTPRTTPGTGSPPPPHLPFPLTLPTPFTPHPPPPPHPPPLPGLPVHDRGRLLLLLFPPGPGRRRRRRRCQHGRSAPSPPRPAPRGSAAPPRLTAVPVPPAAKCSSGA